MTHATNRRSPPATAMLLACLLAATSGAVHAQVVRGVVLDSIQQVPLGGVAVELLSPERMVGREVTDDSGRFVIRVPTSGTYRFRAQRIGYYNLLTIPVPIDTTSEATVTLRLSSLPVALEPIAVTATSQIYLQNTGFYERKTSESGFYLEPDAVIAAASKAGQTADVLDGIPGVTLVSAGGSRGIRIPQFSARSGLGCDNGPRIYLDNHLMNPGSDAIDVNTILAADLLAIEVYRHVAQVPLKFGGQDANCGVIVLWTKR